MKLHEFLEETKDGQIFGVTFIKRTTGEERVMQCRRGVHKDLKGKGLSFKPEERALLTVWDMTKRDPRHPEQRGAYRMISLDTLMELRLKGKAYRWDDELKEFVEKPI